MNGRPNHAGRCESSDKCSNERPARRTKPDRLDMPPPADGGAEIPCGSTFTHIVKVSNDAAALLTKIKQRTVTWPVAGAYDPVDNDEKHKIGRRLSSHRRGEYLRQRKGHSEVPSPIQTSFDLGQFDLAYSLQT